MDLELNFVTKCGKGERGQKPRTFCGRPSCKDLTLGLFHFMSVESWIDASVLLVS